MTYKLFTRVSLAEDLPEYGLHKGDLATIVEKHEGKPGQETGYSLELFNAVGETIAVYQAPLVPWPVAKNVMAVVFALEIRQSSGIHRV